MVVVVNSARGPKLMLMSSGEDCDLSNRRLALVRESCALMFTLDQSLGEFRATSFHCRL